MRPNLSWQARIPRPAIIICAVIVAVVGAAAATWRISDHPAALQHASCGSASTHFLTRNTQILRADRGALTCFVTAARECRSASLGVTEMDIDTGTDFVFVVESGTKTCQVTEQRQDYSANFGGSQDAVSTVSCYTTAVTSTGVALSCRGRNLLIPATVSMRSPLSAGTSAHSAQGLT
jgi:hypothetical protein